MDAADMILPPECAWPSEVVECVNWVTSQLNISPISAFYGITSKPSNITFKVLYQEVLSDRFSSCTLEFHSTPILKTLKASHPLLTLDVQHALSFPWRSLPSPLLCYPSHSVAGYLLFLFSSQFGITSLESFSEPSPLVQAHVCFHSISCHPHTPTLHRSFTF